MSLQDSRHQVGSGMICGFVRLWGWTGVSEMNISHALVQPVEDSRTVEAADVPRLRVKDFQGMPATFSGFTLRLFQFLFSVSALCIMASTSDFPSVTAFRYLVAAAGLQCLWSFSLAITDIYALLVRRSLQNCQLVMLFAVCVGITSTLTFATHRH